MLMTLVVYCLFSLCCVIYYVICITDFFLTLALQKCMDIGGALAKFVQMAYEAIFENFMINAQIEGEINYIFGFKCLFEYLMKP